MGRKAKRILILIIGWIFILVGIAGLFLPVIQGILCIVIGLLILSTEYVWAHRLLQKLKNRFPKIGHASEEAAHKAEKWFRRMTGKGRNSAADDSEGTDRS